MPLLLLLPHLLPFIPLETLGRLTFVSGVGVYLMERRRQELFAHFVERLRTRTQKWW